jgi:DNA-binding NarL/FixJ family response regulator
MSGAEPTPEETRVAELVGISVEELRRQRALREATFKILEKEPGHWLGNMTSHEVSVIEALSRRVDSGLRAAKSAQVRRVKNAARDRKIHELKAEGRAQKVIAAQLRVGVSTVSRVLKRKPP